MSGKLKEVRDRIGSINSTQQITSAMKMVSAAKLKKAQDAIVQIRPYAERLNRILGNIFANLEGDMQSKLNVERDIENVLIIVVTSNRGLCGAFNANIIKSVAEKVKNTYGAHRNAGKLSFLCIGKKGYEHFKKHFSDCTLIDDYVNAFENLNYKAIEPISNRLMVAFESEKYDMVDVAYGRFKNAAVQTPVVVQYLPVEKTEVTVEEAVDYLADYLFEPDKDTLLEELIPSIMRITFHKYLLDTHASEHGARMTAMENATENAKEMLHDLKLEYNKARQEAITSELSEIVSGAAALG